MNAFSSAQRGYAANAETTQTGRRAEYALIAKITHRLRTTAYNADQNFTDYVQALHDNRKLWNTLAVDVADTDNELPETLRTRIFYLSQFTSQHTSKILREKASVMPLLEINMAVLRGLKTEGSRT